MPRRARVPEPTPKPRRRHGEGTKYRRGDRWYCQVTLLDGRRRGHYCDSEEEADKWLISARAAIAEERFADSGGLTVERYLADWLSGFRRQISERSLGNYQNRFGRVIEHIGKVRLDRLTAARCRKMYAEMRDGDELAGSTVFHIHALLRRALRDAVHDRLIPHSPLDRVSLPLSYGEMHVLTREEVGRLITTAERENGPLAPLWTLLPYTGLRIGEAMALRWSDVNLSVGELRVRRTLRQKPGGGVEFAEPKTAASRRRVELAPAVVRALQKLQLRTGGSGDELVFTREGGKPFLSSYVHTHLQRALTRAECPLVRVHDLRHTAATLLLEQGVPANVVAELLGHTDPGFTLRVYGHATPRMHRDAVRRLEEAITGS